MVFVEQHGSGLSPIFAPSHRSALSVRRITPFTSQPDLLLLLSREAILLTIHRIQPFLHVELCMVLRNVRMSLRRPRSTSGGAGNLTRNEHLYQHGVRVRHVCHCTHLWSCHVCDWAIYITFSVFLTEYTKIACQGRVADQKAVVRILCLQAW